MTFCWVGLVLAIPFWIASISLAGVPVLLTAVPGGCLMAFYQRISRNQSDPRECRLTWTWSIVFNIPLLLLFGTGVIGAVTGPVYIGSTVTALAVSLGLLAFPLAAIFLAVTALTHMRCPPTLEEQQTGLRHDPERPSGSKETQ